MKTKLSILIFMACALCLGSCYENAPEPLANMEIVTESGSGDLIFTPAGGETKVSIYSNVGWTIELDFEEDQEEWCSVYPTQGFQDGRVFLTAEELTLPYGRSCRFIVRDRNREEITSFEVIQNGIPAFLTCDPDLISSSSHGGSFSVSVSSNVEWAVSIHPKNAGEDISWVELGDITDATQALAIQENDTGVKRFATLRFTRTDDESLYFDTEIVQLPVFSITNADLLTINELLSQYSDGVIEDNVKVEGFVISDKETHNMPDSLLYIQDAGGLGMVIMFQTESENTYSLHDKVTVWATGTTLITDAASGTRMLTNHSTSNFLDEAGSLTGMQAVPVEVTSLTDIDQYPNTLVTVKNVSFAVPVGTVFNAYYTRADCGPSFMNIIRDGDGKTAYLRTMKTFTEKFNGPKTGYDYDITAIVIPDGGEYVADYLGNRSRIIQELEGNMFHYKNTLHLRSYSDLAVSATMTYTPITMWYSSPKPTVPASGSIYWNPSFGTGTFELRSSESNVAIGARSLFALINPSAAYSDANTYWGYSRTKGAGNSYTDNNWEFSVSTKNLTGDIFISFVQSTFGSAARYWKVQWKGDDDTQWRDLDRSVYELWPYSTSMAAATELDKMYCQQEFSFKLPTAAAGQEKLSIRLQVERNERSYAANASTTVTVADTGPSMLVFVGVHEKN